MPGTVTRSKYEALLAATSQRIESDKFMAAPDVLPFFRPTMRLRWYQSSTGRSTVLQQLWISDDGTAEEWRPVPTVRR